MWPQEAGHESDNEKNEKGNRQGYADGQGVHCAPCTALIPGKKEQTTGQREKNGNQQGKNQQFEQKAGSHILAKIQ